MTSEDWSLEKIILDALFLVPREECGERLRQLYTWYVQCRRREPPQLRPAERQAVANAELRRKLRHLPYAADPGASDAEIVAEAEAIEAKRFLAGR